ncbi:putative transmembrane protein [Gregarina niphandrodes]|uniref:Transmembrane protein n=1 Tax=Gregarina niphandrodes TaxID=110365 RepID=A0A023AY30_GRENI|nr:putative transmembrane protein [Gregarina niphandrodes]EZG43358.1 putative transmembrane protein [Gregarina niphandrodes]|eukprot:XP_011134667.1 putative transmembrane protein [Gregarina niphandrodes]
MRTLQSAQWRNAQLVRGLFAVVVSGAKFEMEMTELRSSETSSANEQDRLMEEGVMEEGLVERETRLLGGLFAESQWYVDEDVEEPQFTLGETNWREQEPFAVMVQWLAALDKSGVAASDSDDRVSVEWSGSKLSEWSLEMAKRRKRFHKMLTVTFTAVGVLVGGLYIWDMFTGPTP